MSTEKVKDIDSNEETEKVTTPSEGVKSEQMEVEDEKQSPEESKLLQEPSTEVKFIAADSQNGDAKIDMENVRLAFSGMGKEELMKFANDPFWVRMRWFLFILFWLIWIAMLAGAIAIIFFAPKCPAAAPREWWEKGPLVPIDLDTFSADGSERSGTLKGLTAGLDTLNSVGMHGIILSSVLKMEEGQTSGGIVDFKDIDPRYGSLDDFKELVAKAKDKGIKVMLTLTPNHSSRKHPWFVQSEKQVEPYTNYYMWYSNAAKGQDEPPNNWKSMNGGSAWEWSSERNAFFLHQFAKNEPDLNYRNPAVINAFKDVLSFWRGLGVGGFRLSAASYLMEDKMLRDEEIAPVNDQEKNSTHTDYGFYRHIYTKNLVENVDLLSQLKQAIFSQDGDNGVFAADVDGTLSSIVQYYGNEEGGGSVVELPLFDTSTQLAATVSAQDMQTVINKWLAHVPNATWPNWMVEPGYISPELEAGFHMVVMLLQGTPVTSYASSVPASSGEPVSLTEERHLMHGLYLARESPSILYGTLDLRVLDDDVLAFTRMKSGNPGYLVLFNLGAVDREINAKEFPSMSEEVSVNLLSPGIKNTSFKDTIQEKGKLKSDAIPLPAKNALVLTFVPEKH